MSTLTVLAVSPHAIKYLLTSDGTDVSLNRSQMLLDTLPGGPLRQVLESADTVAKWDALPDSTFLSIYVSPGTCSAGARFAPVGSDPPPTRGMEVPVCGSGLATIEIRFIHSIGR